MQSEIGGMLHGVETLRPALERFEQSLSERQRAQLGAANAQTGQQSEQRSRGHAICQAAAGLARLPIDRIERAVRPNAVQREAFIDASKDSAIDASKDSATAGDVPEADCQNTLVNGTPLARFQSMEARLHAASKAVEAVHLAIADFYSTLSDDRKARFDHMDSRETMRAGDLERR